MTLLCSQSALLHLRQGRADWVKIDIFNVYLKQKPVDGTYCVLKTNTLLNMLFNEDLSLFFNYNSILAEENLSHIA